MRRTFSTSMIQREVIQQNGQNGSNQKSARSRASLAVIGLMCRDAFRDRNRGVLGTRDGRFRTAY